jgi:hypothetical protein
MSNILNYKYVVTWNLSCILLEIYSVAIQGCCFNLVQIQIDQWTLWSALRIFWLAIMSNNVPLAVFAKIIMIEIWYLVLF